MRRFVTHVIVGHVTQVWNRTPENFWNGTNGKAKSPIRLLVAQSTNDFEECLHIEQMQHNAEQGETGPNAVEKSGKLATPSELSKTSISSFFDDQRNDQSLHTFFFKAKTEDFIRSKMVSGNFT